jgi:hypothetical protein
VYDAVADVPEVPVAVAVNVCEPAAREDTARGELQVLVAPLSSVQATDDESVDDQPKTAEVLVVEGSGVWLNEIVGAGAAGVGDAPVGAAYSHVTVTERTEDLFQAATVNEWVP